MGTPKISILTASCRPEGLPMVGNCLARQTFADFEWLICMPKEQLAKVQMRDPRIRLFSDPPRNEGDFYGLNKAWNQLLAAARGDLLVFVCDWLWFEPDALEQFWSLFEQWPNDCATSIGEHYRLVVDGRPERFFLEDARELEMDKQGKAPHEMPPEFMELSLASMPRKKVLEAGGFDERYDQVAGGSEKELALRLVQIGCGFWLFDKVVHRIWKHPKESTGAQWDTAFLKADQLFQDDIKAMRAGERKTIPFPYEAQPTNG